MNAMTLARGLGWFSLGLGLWELEGSGSLARILGMTGREGTLRGYGLREIGAGAGCLSADKPGPWVWSRIAGDALDLATLAGLLGKANPKRANAWAALGAVAGVTALDIICARGLSRKG